MNTPAHLVLSSVVLGRGSGRVHPWPIVLGALLPDLPMFGFYAWVRFVQGRPESEIWSSIYFEPDWQLVFDVFNSLPIAAAIGFAAFAAGKRAVALGAASMALHCLADLPVHREDAHAHFVPLSDWRFVSPVSYWDPAHFGAVFAPLEMGLAFLGAWSLSRVEAPSAWKWIGRLCMVMYLALAAMVVFVWGPLAAGG